MTMPVNPLSFYRPGPAVPMNLPGMPGVPGMPAAVPPPVTPQPNALGIAGTVPGPGGMPVPGSGGIAPTPSGWEQFGNIMSNPGAIHALAMLGASLSPQGSFGNTVGSATSALTAAPAVGAAVEGPGAGGYWKDPRNRSNASLSLLGVGNSVDPYPYGSSAAAGGGGGGTSNFR